MYIIALNLSSVIFYVNCPKIGRLINWVKNQYNINAVFVHFCISLTPDQWNISKLFPYWKKGWYNYLHFIDNSSCFLHPYWVNYVNFCFVGDGNLLPRSLQTGSHSRLVWKCPKKLSRQWRYSICLVHGLCPPRRLQKAAADGHVASSTAAQ